MNGYSRKKWLCVVLAVAFAFVVYGSIHLYLNHELRVVGEKQWITVSDLQRAKWLLRLGADPNAHFWLDSPLAFVIMTAWNPRGDRNRDLLFIELLEHGADPNARDGWDECPPLLAQGFNLEVEKALIRHGGRLGNNVQTPLGTMLEVEKRGNKEEIELFRAAYEKENQKP